MRTKGLLVISILAMAMFYSCQKDDEEIEPCPDKWSSVQTFNFVLPSVAWNTTYASKLDEMYFLKIEGRIYKQYCDGKISGNFSFGAEFTNEELKTILAAAWFQPLWLPMEKIMIYQYDIEHDDDAVYIEAELSYQVFGDQPRFKQLNRVYKGVELRLIGISSEIDKNFFDGTNYLIYLETEISRP